jgi:hypothetical protein
MKLQAVPGEQKYPTGPQSGILDQKDRREVVVHR